MTNFKRRGFLSSAAAGLGAMALGSQQFSQASPSPSQSPYTGKRQQTGYTGPVGIQLYTLGDAVQRDIDATFATLVQYGYREIEALEYASIAPATIRKAAANAGLLLRSAHLNFGPTDQTGALLDIGAAFGVSQVASSVLPPQAQDLTQFINSVNSLSIDDYKRIAARANRIGEQARRVGLRYAYHNHNYEFRNLGRGVVGYDILLRETDPALVQFEADCGWMRAAGANPVHYLKRYADRFTSMHVKNFDTVNFSTTLDAASQSHVAAFGSGAIDYLPILSAALEAGVSQFFLEHDPRNGVPIASELVKQELVDLNVLLAKVRYDLSSR